MASRNPLGSDLMNGDGVIADLMVISYDKLLRKDEEESARLLSACKEWGFFYLDLSSGEARTYLSIVEEMFEVSKEYFGKPLEEKLKDTREEMSIFNICGYKPLGLDTGNVEHKRDGCEGLRIPTDLVFNLGEDPQLSQPEGAQPYWSSFVQYIRDSHGMANMILERLSDSMGLEAGQRFEERHSANGTSTSTAVLQHYPLDDLPADVSVGHFTHTDTGSVTILFNTEWGLQVYCSERDSWEYVKPQKNMAIINLGDSLKFLSDFQLKSCLHRVVPWHRKWESGSRYASIFFLRPNNSATFRDTEGNQWTAGDWLNRKFSNYRSPHDEQRKSAIATGRKGFVGLWEAQMRQAVLL